MVRVRWEATVTMSTQGGQENSSDIRPDCLNVSRISQRVGTRRMLWHVTMRITMYTVTLEIRTSRFRINFWKKQKAISRWITFSFTRPEMKIEQSIFNIQIEQLDFQGNLIDLRTSFFKLMFLVWLRSVSLRFSSNFSKCSFIFLKMQWTAKLGSLSTLYMSIVYTRMIYLSNCTRVFSKLKASYLKIIIFRIINDMIGMMILNKVFSPKT